MSRNTKDGGLPRVPMGITTNRHPYSVAPTHLKTFNNMGRIHTGKGAPGKINLKNGLPINDRKVRGGSRFFNHITNGRSTHNRVLDLTEAKIGDHEYASGLIMAKTKAENMNDLDLEHTSSSINKGWSIGRFYWNMRYNSTWNSVYGKLLDCAPILDNFQPPQMLITDPLVWDDAKIRQPTQAIALVARGKITDVPNVWHAMANGYTDNASHLREDFKCWWLLRRYKIDPFIGMRPSTWETVRDDRSLVVETLAKQREVDMEWTKDPDPLMKQLKENDCDLGKGDEWRSKLMQLSISHAVPVNTDINEMLKDAKTPTDDDFSKAMENSFNGDVFKTFPTGIAEDIMNVCHINRMFTIIPAHLTTKTKPPGSEQSLYAWAWFPWGSYSSEPPPFCLFNGEHGGDPYNKYKGYAHYMGKIDVPRDGNNGLVCEAHTDTAQKIIFPESLQPISTDEYNTLPKVDMFVKLGYRGAYAA